VELPPNPGHKITVSVEKGAIIHAIGH
jgi:hypothetical protein